MRSSPIIVLSIVAASCRATNVDEPRYQEPRVAISSLATVLARNSDNYRTIVSNRQIARNRLQSDPKGQYYFDYGVLGRCYPRDNSQDIGEDDAATRPIDEVTCYQGGAFTVSAVVTSFGRIFLASPPPDSFGRPDPPNIPEGERVYRFGTSDPPSNVGLELTTTGPKGLWDAIFEQEHPILNDQLSREYGAKLKVREVRLWRR